ncbi:MAG: hypothetical protein M1831_001183 [Alyxoria varia]|nr:MAG: hypothetical protein M1831_001183 [Alyxoria varia]
MADATTKGGKNAWTDSEKVALLFAIIDHHSGPIKWNEIPIPPGRTIKSCTHVIAKLRNLAKETGNGEGAAGEANEPMTPKSTPRKRKAPTSPKKANGDDGDEQAQGTPQPKRKRVAKPKTPKNVAADGTDDEEQSSEGKKKVKEEPVIKSEPDQEGEETEAGGVAREVA